MRGAEVTLFASGDSHTAATLVPVWPKALRLDGSVRDACALHMMMLEQVRRRAADFDLLHFHLDYYPFSLFSRQPTPFVTTLHGRLDLPEHQPVFTTFSSVPVISISDAQRQTVPQAGWVRTVHHGLPEQLLTPRPVQPSYLAVLGRISPEKGIDRAIRIAGRCGLPLKIAAKVDKVDRDYFNDDIRPLIVSPHVEHVGEISDGEKSAFLSGALALLVPIDWPEPFGLVMIEAMACGTPVIAFNRGSVPEVVENGLTGFIVNDAAGASRIRRTSGAIAARRDPSRFEERFTRVAWPTIMLVSTASWSRPRSWDRGSLRVSRPCATASRWAGSIVAAQTTSGRISGSRSQTRLSPKAAIAANPKNVTLLPK